MAMIAKAIKGMGFRGALEYDLNKERGRVIDTNMSGSTPRALAHEFGEIRKLRPGLNKAVLHVSLSAAPGEHLSDAQWTAIAGRYLEGMGMDRNQYVVTRHNDTEHEHVHLVVNRIQFDGQVTSDSHDYRRQEVLMRGIERDFGLQRVPPSKEVLRHAATKGEIEQSLRTGEASTRQRLQQLCDGAVRNCASFSEYAARLEAAGVTLVPVLQMEGTRLSGLSYQLDGVMMKGSDLGRGYSPMGLAKRGVSYDKERDHAAVGRCLERGTAGGVGAADRGPAPGEADQRGGTGRAAGAAGAGHGRADRPDAAEPDPDRGARARAGTPREGAGQPSRDGLPERGGGGKERGGPAAGGRGGDVVAPLPAGGADRSGHGDARGRILALAGITARDGVHPEREGVGRDAAARDRSLEAAQGQIAAMGVERVVVTLINAKQGQKEQGGGAYPTFSKIWRGSSA
jgi:hypothetical protein